MTEKHNPIKSRFHGQTWSDYPTVSLPISELWASVPRADTWRGIPFYSKLIKDIEENGLHFPLLVVHATGKDLLELKQKWGDKISELPFDPNELEQDVRQYVIWGGSNRVRAAEELGYTHIDCVIIEDFEKAHKMQKLHRRPYAKQYHAQPDATAPRHKAPMRGALWSKALSNLEKASKNNSKTEPHWIDSGTCLEAMGRHQEAAEAFINAQETNPRNSDIYPHIFRNLYLAGNFELLFQFASFCNQLNPVIVGKIAKDTFFAHLFEREEFKDLPLIPKPEILPQKPATEKQQQFPNVHTQHGPKKIAIYNDCLLSGKRHHFGCELVMKTFEEQLDRVGVELIGTVKYTKREDLGILDEADLTIVNGEGSFHHNRRNDLAEISCQYPSILINTVFQENTGIDLSRFKYISTRESFSQRELMESTGVYCEMMPDIIFSSKIIEGIKPNPSIDLGHIRHFSDIATLQPADSFLDQVSKCRTVTSESFHGIIVAKLLGIPVTGHIASNTFKNEALIHDFSADQDYVRNAKAQINRFFEETLFTLF